MGKSKGQQGKNTKASMGKNNSAGNGGFDLTPNRDTWIERIRNGDPIALSFIDRLTSGMRDITPGSEILDMDLTPGKGFADPGQRNLTQQLLAGIDPSSFGSTLQGFLGERDKYGPSGKALSGIIGGRNKFGQAAGYNTPNLSVQQPAGGVPEFGGLGGPSARRQVAGNLYQNPETFKNPFTAGGAPVTDTTSIMPERKGLQTFSEGIDWGNGGNGNGGVTGDPVQPGDPDLPQAPWTPGDGVAGGGGDAGNGGGGGGNTPADIPKPNWVNPFSGGIGGGNVLSQIADNRGERIKYRRRTQDARKEALRAAQEQRQANRDANALGNANNPLKDTLRGLQDLGQGAFDKFQDTARQTQTNIRGGLQKGVKNLFGIPSAAIGGAVQNDGLVNVHKGETIVPPGQTPAQQMKKPLSPKPMPGQPGGNESKFDFSQIPKGRGFKPGQSLNQSGVNPQGPKTFRPIKPKPATQFGATPGKPGGPAGIGAPKPPTGGPAVKPTPLGGGFNLGALATKGSRPPGENKPFTNRQQTLGGGFMSMDMPGYKGQNMGRVGQPGAAAPDKYKAMRWAEEQGEKRKGLFNSLPRDVQMRMNGMDERRDLASGEFPPEMLSRLTPDQRANLTTLQSGQATMPTDYQPASLAEQFAGRRATQTSALDTAAPTGKGAVDPATQQRLFGGIGINPPTGDPVELPPQPEVGEQDIQGGGFQESSDPSEGRDDPVAEQTGNGQGGTHYPDGLHPDDYVEPGVYVPPPEDPGRGDPVGPAVEDGPSAGDAIGAEQGEDAPVITPPDPVTTDPIDPPGTGYPLPIDGTKGEEQPYVDPGYGDASYNDGVDVYGENPFGDQATMLAPGQGVEGAGALDYLQTLGAGGGGALIEQNIDPLRAKMMGEGSIVQQGLEQDMQDEAELALAGNLNKDTSERYKAIEAQMDIQDEKGKRKLREQLGMTNQMFGSGEQQTMKEFQLESAANRTKILADMHSGDASAARNVIQSNKQLRAQMGTAAAQIGKDLGVSAAQANAQILDFASQQTSAANQQANLALQQKEQELQATMGQLKGQMSQAQWDLTYFEKWRDMQNDNYQQRAELISQNLLGTRALGDKQNATNIDRDISLFG